MSAEDILLALSRHKEAWLTSKQIAKETSLSHSSIIHGLRGLRKSNSLLYRDWEYGYEYQHRPE